MDVNFPKSLAFVLKEEGGSDDDPHDPGGRTSRGILQREYNAFCALHNSPSGDVWDMPQATCDQIYHVGYWNPYCPVLPSGLDLLFFDTAVNEGMHEAILLLQRSLGVIVDGHFGIVTAHAVKTIVLLPAILNTFTVMRKNTYRQMRQFRYFGKGWLARADAALAAAKELT